MLKYVWIYSAMSHLQVLLSHWVQPLCVTTSIMEVHLSFLLAFLLAFLCWPWSAWCAFRSFDMFPYEFVVFCCQIATAGEKGCSAEVLQKAGVVIDSLWVHRCTAYDSYVTTCPGVMKRPDLAKFHNNMLQLTSTNYVRHISAYFVWSFCSLVVSGLRSGRSQDDHLANSTDCCVSNFDNSHRFAHFTNVKHVFNVFADFFISEHFQQRNM